MVMATANRQGEKAKQDVVAASGENVNAEKTKMSVLRVIIFMIYGSFLIYMLVFKLPKQKRLEDGSKMYYLDSEGTVVGTLILLMTLNSSGESQEDTETLRTLALPRAEGPSDDRIRRVFDRRGRLPAFGRFLFMLSRVAVTVGFAASNVESMPDDPNERLYHAQIGVACIEITGTSLAILRFLFFCFMGRGVADVDQSIRFAGRFSVLRCLPLANAVRLADVLTSSDKIRTWPEWLLQSTLTLLIVPVAVFALMVKVMQVDFMVNTCLGISQWEAVDLICALGFASNVAGVMPDPTEARLKALFVRLVPEKPDEARSGWLRQLGAQLHGLYGLQAVPLFSALTAEDVHDILGAKHHQS